MSCLELEAAGEEGKVPKPVMMGRNWILIEMSVGGMEPACSGSGKVVIKS